MAGTALGVDLSTAMLARARRASREQGLTNVSFLRADAQTHPLPPERFDLGVSRFGTMFFNDPVAAFTNIARALRPGARLVQLVWQHSDRQQWSAVIRDVFGHEPAPAPAADPFSLADPATVDAIMTAPEPRRRVLRFVRLAHHRPSGMKLGGSAHPAEGPSRL